MHKQADKILKKLGGPRRVAVGIGVDPTTVYKWTYEKDRGGTGGIIPSASVAKVQKLSVVMGVELTAEDWTP